MKRTLLAVLLAAGAAPSRAQATDADAPPAGFGLSQAGDSWAYRAPNAAPRTLSADERARLTEFFTALPVDGRRPALAAPVLAELSREGRDPAGSGDSSRLTAQGREEVAAAARKPVRTRTLDDAFGNKNTAGVIGSAAAANAALLNDWPGADPASAPLPRPAPRPLR